MKYKLDEYTLSVLGGTTASLSDGRVVSLTGSDIVREIPATAQRPASKLIIKAATQADIDDMGRMGYKFVIADTEPAKAEK